jgi:hypothetical protein
VGFFAASFALAAAPLRTKSPFLQTFIIAAMEPTNLSDACFFGLPLVG